MPDSQLLPDRLSVIGTVSLPPQQELYLLVAQLRDYWFHGADHCQSLENAAKSRTSTIPS